MNKKLEAILQQPVSFYRLNLPNKIPFTCTQYSGYYGGVRNKDSDDVEDDDDDSNGNKTKGFLVELLR